MKITKGLLDLMVALANVEIFTNTIQRFNAVTAAVETATEESLDRCEVCANE